MKTNWPTKKLGEVCDFVFGYSFRADDFNESGDGLPVIRIGDIDKGITKKFYNKKYNNKYLVNNSEILIGLSGSIKVNKWKGKKALLNQRIVKVHNFPSGVSENFVYYQLPKVLKRLEIQISQGTVKNVLLPHLFNLKILVSSLSIQQKIVERLNAIRKAQELNEKQIESAEELFQSLLNKELNPKGKNWESRKLGELSKVIRGASPRPKGDPKYFGGTIPWIKISDITKDTNPFYLTRTEEGVTEEGKNKSVFLKKGTLIVTNSGTVGVPRVLAIDGCIHDGFLAFLNLKPIIKRDFLYYQFLKIKKRLDRIAPSGTQRNLNTTIVKNWKMPLPPLEIQCQIVEKLLIVQDYKKKLFEQRQKLQELFECVLHKSFSGENL